MHRIMADDEDANRKPALDCGHGARWCGDRDVQAADTERRLYRVDPGRPWIEPELDHQRKGALPEQLDWVEGGEAAQQAR